MVTRGLPRRLTILIIIFPLISLLVYGGLTYLFFFNVAQKESQQALLRYEENFLQLQDELADTENKIQAARRFYNGQVRDFDTKTQTFPNNIFTGMLNFKDYEFFEANEKEKENVKVKF